MELAAEQEQALVEQARKLNSYHGLMYYYLARGQSRRVRDLECGNVTDSLTKDLILGAEDPGGPARLAERGLEGASDAWLYYGLAKLLLRAGRVEGALRVAVQRLEAAPHDGSVLNLIGRSLVAQRDYALAGEVLNRSLARNPFQEDVKRLVERLDAGDPPRAEVRLDLAPRPAPVCFYVPVYNVEAFIRQAIEGILAQHHPVAEILVIDDGSEDGSIDLAREYPVSIIEHAANRGLAAARNTAFRRASCGLLAAIDTDARPDPGYAKYALMEFENGDETLGGVGGMLVEQHTDSLPDAWRARHLAQHWGDVRLCPPNFLFGSNSVFRKEAVLDVGGYDERYRTNAEDAELCVRLRDRGYDLCYTPAAKAYHLRRDTLESLLRTRWNYEFWYRHAHGFLTDLAAVVAHLDDLLDAAMAFVHKDLADDETRFLYVDLLTFFYDVLASAAYGVEHGAVASSEGRWLQDSVLGVLGQLDVPTRDALHKRVSQHLGQLLIDAQPVPPPSSDIAQQLHRDLSGVRARLGELSPAFFRILSPS